MFPQVRKLVKEEVSFVATKDPKKNTLKIVVVTNGEVLEMEVKLDKINIVEKIPLHRQTCKVLYDDLFQSNLEISKLKLVLEKLEGQLRKEKVGNRENQTVVLFLLLV